MSNLYTKPGENNCYYNIDGKCTNPGFTKNKPKVLGGTGIVRRTATLRRTGRREFVLVIYLNGRCH